MTRKWIRFLVKFFVIDTGAFMDSLDKKGVRANTTVINSSELFEGALISSNIVSMFLLPGRLQRYLLSSEKKGEMLDFQDIAIASISIANNETLVTRNIKHFSRIKGLKIEKL